VRYRKSAKAEADTASAASCTPVKEGSLKSRSGSIGSLTRCSIAMNAPSSAADPANSETIMVLPHPSSLPRTSARTSRSNAALKEATPAQSTRVALGSRLSRSFR
jgi:hypothetical protein